MPRPLNRFVNDFSRDELLEELRFYVDDDGLNHAGALHGQEIGDRTTLSDDDLRELLKLARWRATLWRELDE